MNIEARLKILRNKPEHIRKRYAFWTSLGLTAVIFAFWASSFSFGGVSTKSSVISSVDKVGSPSQSLVASVGSLFVDIKEIVFGTKKINYASVEAIPGKIK